MSGELEAKPASSCALLPPNHPPRPAGPPCKPEYQPYVPPHVTWQVTSSRAKRPPTRSRPLSAPSPPVGSSDRSALGSLRTTAVPGVPGPWPPFSLVPPAPCLSSALRSQLAGHLQRIPVPWPLRPAHPLLAEPPGTPDLHSMPWSRCNKPPQTGWLKAMEMYSLKVLEGRSSKSRC